MANIDAPNGFTPSYHRNGGVVRYDGNYKIASELASDIFLGDLVIIDATADGVHIDVGAAASTRILGVFAGCNYTAANGDVVWAKQWVSGTATLGGVSAEAHVYTDPNIVYTAQVDVAIAEADLFGYADSLQTHAGNANSNCCEPHQHRTELTTQTSPPRFREWNARLLRVSSTSMTPKGGTD
jgi:hypothetical protein